MVLITITRWKRKLLALLVCVCLLVGLGLGLNWYLTPKDNATVAPSDNLQKDVTTQPVKVQGQPANSNSPTKNANPATTVPKK
ncbi:MAG: hypothetical protein ACOY3J_11530 [Bacillota bacterium]|uniref:Uncharacterized protein n=1 Tax=Thermanaerosceptrum fracticalcis TaxID=1712410 RepID=A0A7G6E0G0_THEFR|nr:hypothetical protein [Thermanaerosceptrum fracticalcis]QNB45564.1 hypothetical protein BR63_04065 [Thermanaerosceptrum fracticalcis]